MQFGDIKFLLVNYFDIDYRIAFVIACIILSVYFVVLSRAKYMKKKIKQSVLKKDIVCGIILSVYMALLISWTMLDRSIGGEYQIKLIPFWSYGEFFRNRDRNLAIQIINNIILFIPWGILYPIISKTMQKFRWCIISAWVFSVLIEIIQLVFKCGLFEFDDIFHNTLGTIIGYYIWRNIDMFVRHIKSEEKSLGRRQSRE